MNGLNEPTLTMYERLLSTHQLVAIQETKFTKEDSLQTNEHFIHVADSGARCFWTDSTSPVFNGRHGVGLVLSSASPFGEVVDLTANAYKDQLRNRYLLLKTSLGDKTVYLHVVYAPDEPQQRGEFFRMLPVHFNDAYTGDDEDDRSSMHLVVGDFNVTMDNYLDQASPSQHLPGTGREELCDWLDALGLMDAWRFANPEERDFTSPTRKNRLDYCFLTVDLLQDHLATVSHVRDRKWHGEDHIPVEFRLQAKFLPRTKRTPWRCPYWLLRDAEVQEHLITSAEELADRILLFPGTNPGCLLDEHKRANSIYLRRKWIELRNADAREMASKVEAVNNAVDLYNTAPFADNQEAVESSKAELAAYRELIKERNEAKKFAADLHMSERATCHFFRPPQQDCLRAPITEIQRDDGSVSEDPGDIADGHRRYWGTLFQSTSADLHHLRTASYHPLRFATMLRDTAARLTAAQQAMLDAPLTANDFYWAIMKSKNGKAPGPDGLPIEYYKLAPSLWARIYEVVHDYQLHKGKMTKFQRRAHLSLLYKAGDRSVPGNYRPLTLLNHDAKLGPKILAWRLGAVLPTIIHEDQKGFVPGRSIRHLLLQFQDLQEICTNRYPDACAVLIDFAKAFDSVLWPALDMVLHHFGFGATFRAWVKTFYAETSVSILLNNSPGDPFLLGAGVRQGDPLSPGLFVVFIEPMMNFLRIRFQYKGLSVNDSAAPHLLMAFADDCTGMVQDVHDAETFLRLVQEYATAAGLRLNAKKTCIMPFTRQVSQVKLNRIRTSTDYQVLGPTDTVKLLGILQGASITPVERLSAVLVKMRERCAIWKYRARTLRGKVVLLQGIILPLLWYTTSVTHVPPQILKKVDIIVRNFVHSQDTSSDTACRGKFNKEWIFTGISKGGLGLTPIKTFIQATHLKCLRDGIAAANETGQAPRWLLPALEIFSDALGSLGYGFDILYADMKSTQWNGIPEYWRSTLRLWADLHISHGTTKWKGFAQFMPLWFNTHFAFGKGKLPLSMVSKGTNGALKALGFVRLHDFVEQFGDFATVELLSTLLYEEDFPRPASRTRLIKDTIARFGLIVPQEGPQYGPVRSTLVESACHGWSLGDLDVIHMANRHFVRLLLDTRSHQDLPLLPLDRLHLADFTPTDDTWCREIAWDQHVLPVCADLKFRLQHNALGFRYKFAWRTEVDTSTDCVHGCEALEDAQHLFWLCPIACFQWDIYLAPFADLTNEDLGWRHVMFPGAIQLRTSIAERFGDFAIRATFNIVRCCVLRALWLHRNKRLYNPEVSTSSQFVKHHAAAYIQLHLRQYRRQAWKDGLKKSVKWVDHMGMILGMVVKTMSDPSTMPIVLPTYSTAMESTLSTESSVSAASSSSHILAETLSDLFRMLDLNRRA